MYSILVFKYETVKVVEVEFLTYAICVISIILISCWLCNLRNTHLNELNNILLI